MSGRPGRCNFQLIPDSQESVVRWANRDDFSARKLFRCRRRRKSESAMKHSIRCNFARVHGKPLQEPWISLGIRHTNRKHLSEAQISPCAVKNQDSRLQAAVDANVLFLCFSLPSNKPCTMRPARYILPILIISRECRISKKQKKKGKKGRKKKGTNLSPPLPFCLLPPPQLHSC